MKKDKTNDVLQMLSNTEPAQEFGPKADSLTLCEMKHFDLSGVLWWPKVCGQLNIIPICDCQNHTVRCWKLAAGICSHSDTRALVKLATAVIRSGDPVHPKGVG